MGKHKTLQEEAGWSLELKIWGWEGHWGCPGYLHSRQDHQPFHHG